MTNRNKEIYNTFQLFYDNLNSHQAPGLDTYEISKYLTDAQNDLIRSMYEQFEQSEDARKMLVPLVNTYIGKEFVSDNTKKISKESKYFALPSDVLYVLYETVKYNTTEDIDKCLRGISCDVFPVSHDEFHNTYRNPFKYNTHRALRLDVNIDNIKMAEIISKVCCKEYYMRYIRCPKPIILETIDTTKDENGNIIIDDNINGEVTEHEPELDRIYDNIIVQAASNKAYQHYKA